MKSKAEKYIKVKKLFFVGFLLQDLIIMRYEPKKFVFIILLRSLKKMINFLVSLTHKKF
jgi:hypothetical protein